MEMTLWLNFVQQATLRYASQEKNDVEEVCRLFFVTLLRARQLQMEHCAATFESFAASFTINAHCTTFFVIYRPPSFDTNRFLEEFSSLLEGLATYRGKLLIVGDFNVHADVLLELFWTVVSFHH